MFTCIYYVNDTTIVTDKRVRKDRVKKLFYHSVMNKWDQILLSHCHNKALFWKESVNTLYQYWKSCIIYYKCITI